MIIATVISLSQLFNASIHGLLTFPLMLLVAAAPINAFTPSPTDLSKSALRAQPPAKIAQPFTIKIVTFNVQDLPPVGFNRPARMRAIGEVLTELDPDIVGIQEGFVAEDREVLYDALKNSRLQHHRYYRSGLLGSGLLTLSAYPINEALFHRYVAGGKWYKPFHGDWWAGKGISLARIQLPDGGYIDFYNTHAHAGYGGSSGNEYGPIRMKEMTEWAEFVMASATGSSPAIGVGDFNCSAGAPDFERLVNQGGLLRQMTTGPSIDNIFAVNTPHYTFETLDTRVIEKIIPVPSGETPLSDHPGYISTIRITPTGS